MTTKKTICVTVDLDAYLSAKQKLINISQYVNESLKALTPITKNEIKKEELQEQIKSIENSIQELSIKKSILNMELKTFEEQMHKEKKAQEEAEKFNRWVCPVCNHKNTMDTDRCSNCALKTQNDSKTVIVNIKEN